MEITVGKNTENPFQGLKYCLEVYQQGGKGEVNTLNLSRAWDEVKGDLRKRQMFFSLLFSIGDITARQHNIFKGDVIESGGNAQREAFIKILEWLKMQDYSQYVKFLYGHLFNEYVSFDTLLANRVKTSGKTKAKVERVYKSLSSKDEDLIEYCANVIQGNNETEKYFLAKYLSRPRTSKRSKSKRMLSETKEIMKNKILFYQKLSKRLNFKVTYGPEYLNFVGLNEWKKKYNQTLESVLFSSKEILKFDKQQFLDYLEKLPSSARYRVRCRVLTSDNKIKPKWNNLGSWYLEWETYKKNKQSEVRKLEEQIRQQGSVDAETIQKLERAKKEAKVNIGANNFRDIFADIVRGTVDEVKLQPFLDKVKLPYNTLVFVDDSGSMMSTSSSFGFTAFDFASFMATICLIKNPEDSGRDLIGYFSRKTRMFTGIDVTSESANRILSSVTTHVPKGSLIQPEKSFLENLERIRNFGKAIRTSNNTNISSIPAHIHSWVNGDSVKLEMLQSFPVWTIISDGNWNNLYSPEASMKDFMNKCMQYFGFKPFIIAIDVSSYSPKATQFEGIENFMFIPPNPAQVEQLLTNFSDFEIMDIYTPLNSLYKSNRYALVRKFTV